MPKTKIAPDAVLDAAFSVLRAEGYPAVNARSVAQRAGCSVQPIYSCFDGMEALMEALYRRAMDFLDRFVEERADRDNYFESIGQCHIRLAAEEPEVFRFLFLSPYLRTRTFDQLYSQFGREDVARTLRADLGLTADEVETLYLDLMLFTHGIASLIALGGAGFPPEEIHQKCDGAYHAFLAQIRKEGRKNEAAPS